MSPETARLVRMGLSSLMAGAMATGTNLLSTLNAGGQFPKGAVTIALISGGLMMAKDLGAYLATPPTTTQGA